MSARKDPERPVLVPLSTVYNAVADVYLRYCYSPDKGAFFALAENRCVRDDISVLPLNFDGVPEWGMPPTNPADVFEKFASCPDTNFGEQSAMNARHIRALKFQGWFDEEIAPRFTREIDYAAAQDMAYKIAQDYLVMPPLCDYATYDHAQTGLKMPQLPEKTSTLEELEAIEARPPRLQIAPGCSNLDVINAMANYVCHMRDLPGAHNFTPGYVRTAIRLYAHYAGAPMRELVKTARAADILPAESRILHGIEQDNLDHHIVGEAEKHLGKPALADLAAK